MAVAGLARARHAQHISPTSNGMNICLDYTVSRSPKEPISSVTTAIVSQPGVVSTLLVDQVSTAHLSELRAPSIEERFPTLSDDLAWNEQLEELAAGSRSATLSGEQQQSSASQLEQVAETSSSTARGTFDTAEPRCEDSSSRVPTLIGPGGPLLSTPKPDAERRAQQAATGQRSLGAKTLAEAGHHLRSPPPKCCRTSWMASPANPPMTPTAAVATSRILQVVNDSRFIAPPPALTPQPAATCGLQTTTRRSASSASVSVRIARRYDASSRATVATAATVAGSSSPCRRRHTHVCSAVFEHDVEIGDAVVVHRWWGHMGVLDGTPPPPGWTPVATM